MFRGFAIIACCLLAFGFQKSQRSTKTTSPTNLDFALHGTVNILIANKNGLVAVTDSRLSSSAGRQKTVQGRDVEGKKLFRLDARTVCTVAGAYSLSGPDLHDTGILGTALIPAEVASYIAQRQAERHQIPFIVAEHIRPLSDALALSFSMAFNLRAISHSPLGKQQQIEISIAGFDDRLRPQLGQVELTPNADSTGVVRYSVGSPRIQTVEGNELIFAAAGSGRSVVLPLLENPRAYKGHNISIKAFVDAKASHSEGSLSLGTLGELARALENEAANAYPEEIGGTPEIAALHDGALASFNNELTGVDISTLSKGTSVVTSLSWMDQSSGCISLGQPKRPAGLVIGGKKTFLIVTRSTVSNCTQSLDKFAFSDTTFNGVTLEYSGSPVAIFDETNHLINTDLEVSLDVPQDDAFLVSIEAAYPKLIVRRVASAK